MTSQAFELMWGTCALVGGGVVVANVCRMAERFQAMSYAYRSWPASVTTCRVIGGIFMLAGAGVLGAAAFGV
ncbi:hypothetical protein [Streptomyces marianii]|uniref:Uncharacterized protein n=1 Tax=Streptomyces marianii TaxID=1817406 RepID=A0A5R9E7R2_9ACTN|nr:hypothetical protein [Streptomyces marianii]TLQ44842.1 hypothetical protein FEF34_18705 [Streptomyces marianii]